MEWRWGVTRHAPARLLRHCWRQTGCKGWHPAATAAATQRAAAHRVDGHGGMPQRGPERQRPSAHWRCCSQLNIDCDKLAVTECIGSVSSTPNTRPPAARLGRSRHTCRRTGPCWQLVARTSSSAAAPFAAATVTKLGCCNNVVGGRDTKYCTDRTE